MRMVSAKRAGVSACDTSAKAMWIVTGTTRNGTDTAAGWAAYFLDNSSVLPDRPSEPLPTAPAHCSYDIDALLSVGGPLGRANVISIPQNTLMDVATGGTRNAGSRWDECMWPWEGELTSLADGILDDETYDWLAVVEGMLDTGGSPLEETWLAPADVAAYERVAGSMLTELGYELSGEGS